MSKLRNYAAGAALAVATVALGGCYYAPAPGYGYAPAYGYAPGYYAAPAYGYAPYGGGVSLSFGGRGHGRW